MAQGDAGSHKLPALGWADVGIGGVNAVGVVAIARFNTTGIIAIGGASSRSSLPLS